VNDLTNEHRVLLLTPTRRDALATAKLLAQADIVCTACADVAMLCSELSRGAAAILMAEEVLGRDGCAMLEAELLAQPTWSDLPVLILTRAGFDSRVAAKALVTLGNVTLIERPVRVPTLLSGVRTAVRSRMRQYQIRQYLAEREKSEVILRDNDRRKDEFLAMLAHELRNPLSAISNAVQIIKRPEAAGHHPWASGVIETHVVHLARMIDDLLDVSRITRGKITLKKEPLDLAEVIRSAVETSRPFIKERQHHIEADLTHKPVMFDGDPTRLEQIFVNLLNNAAKYTEPGGHVRVSAEVINDEFIATIEDNGIGMQPELVAGAFGLFAQGDRTTARSEGGLGIGLTLVRSLVAMHGGQVWATSEGIGMGSRFSVRLPLKDHGCQPGHALLPDTEVDSSAHARILVVDDNVDAADGLAQILTLHGHEVHTSNDGPAALHLASEVDLDVILLDIGLPGMDGFKVAELLRKKHLKKTLIIAVSGYGTEQAPVRAEKLAFDHYLVKPIDLAALRRLISSRQRWLRGVVRLPDQRRPRAALRVRRVFSPFLTWSSPAATSGKSATSPSWKAEGSAPRTSA